MMPCPYGFRILGSVAEPRRLVDAATALAAYASCDERAEVNREAYLSAFQFGDEMRRYIDPCGNGSTAGYTGPCWSPWLWFDIDRDSLDAALYDARRLAAAIDERYKLADDTLLVFFSGSKGFHVGLPTVLWSPVPSPTFHRVCRRFAETIAEVAGVAIDSGVYDAVRAFRAPNSRHAKTGLHKRRLSLDELLGLSLERIRRVGRRSRHRSICRTCGATPKRSRCWPLTGKPPSSKSPSKAKRRLHVEPPSNGTPTLNRSTLEFVCDGAGNGDRHRLLFSAAANLGEFGCPPALAHALLTEAGLDSGLPPKDVRRQIDCGLAVVAATPQATPSASEPLDDVAGSTASRRRFRVRNCRGVMGIPAAPADVASRKSWNRRRLNRCNAPRTPTRPTGSTNRLPIGRAGFARRVGVAVESRLSAGR